MRRISTSLLLLFALVAGEAQALDRRELARQLLKCSFLYLSIAELKSEERSKDLESFVNRGAGYQGMALALTSPKFVESEIERLAQSLGGDAASVVDQLSADSVMCHQLPKQHAREISIALDQIKRVRRATQ